MDVIREKAEGLCGFRDAKKEVSRPYPCLEAVFAEWDKLGNKPSRAGQITRGKSMLYSCNKLGFAHKYSGQKYRNILMSTSAIFPRSVKLKR